MTRRVFEKLCTKKFALIFLPPKRSANKGLPLPLGCGVCAARPNPKMGAPHPENPLFLGFSVLRGGLRPWSQTMVSEGARPWGRGRSKDCEKGVFGRGGSCNNRFVLKPEVAIASKVSNLSKSSLATTNFLSKKTQLVNYCEKPFSEPSIWGRREGGHLDLFRFVPISPFSSDLFRFALLVFGNTPICSDLLRFLPWPRGSTGAQRYGCIPRSAANNLGEIPQNLGAPNPLF